MSMFATVFSNLFYQLCYPPPPLPVPPPPLLYFVQIGRTTSKLASASASDYPR
jgi:hypothetical protein